LSDPVSSRFEKFSSVPPRVVRSRVVLCVSEPPEILKVVFVVPKLRTPVIEPPLIANDPVESAPILLIASFPAAVAITAFPLTEIARFVPPFA